MKESKYSPYPKLVFRETFNDEAAVRRNGGTPNAITFFNGVGRFNGTTSKVNYNLNLNGTYSVRMRFTRLNVIVNSIFFDPRGDGSGVGNIFITNGNLLSSVGGTKYVNGLTGDVLTSSTKEIVVSGLTLTTVGGIASFIGARYTNSSFLDGDIELVEIYQGTLTASEVKNLYDQDWNKELPYTLQRTVPQYACNLNVSGWRRCADNTGADQGANGVGQALKRVGLGSGLGAGTDIVGFNADLPGYRDTVASFDYLGSFLVLWSSTPAGATTAWRRYLLTSYSTVGRSTGNMAYGFSVRCLRDTDDTSDFTDSRDGYTYHCVKIGNQVWMKENLAYLPSVNAVADGSETDPKYYVYDYNGTDVATAKATANYIANGVLYNYPAAIISAPIGFHVPSDEEINILEIETVRRIKEAYPDKCLLDFDSTSGTLKDRTGKNTLTPTAVILKKIGQSYSADFNGTTSLIDTGSDFIGTKAVTVCGWIKPYGYGEYLGAIGDILNNAKFHYGVFNSGGFKLFSNSDGVTPVYSNNGAISLNKWHFVALTRKADGKASFYIGDKNTAPGLSASADQASGTPAAGTTNIILGNNSAGQRTFDGKIPMLKVYEGILSIEDITQIWSSTRGKFI